VRGKRIPYDLAEIGAGAPATHHRLATHADKDDDAHPRTPLTVVSMPPPCSPREPASRSHATVVVTREEEESVIELHHEEPPRRDAPVRHTRNRRFIALYLCRHDGRALRSQGPPTLATRGWGQEGRRVVGARLWVALPSAPRSDMAGQTVSLHRSSNTN
jgi:hypothetical protein